MQQIFLAFIIFCCFVDFATNFTNISLAKSNKKTSVMMKTFVKISAKSLPENLTLLSKSYEATPTTDYAEVITNNSIQTSVSNQRLEIKTTEITTTLTPTKRQIKLNARQNIIMNQIIGVYALNGIKDQLCKNHTLEYKTALRNFEPWALKSKNKKYLDE